jgi:hypothetical protein
MKNLNTTANREETSRVLPVMTVVTNAITDQLPDCAV